MAMALRTFWSGTRQRPLATVVGFLAISGGLSALLHIGTTSDALSALIPEWLTVALSVCYLVSGLGLLLGMGFYWTNVEAGALVLLAAGVVARGIAVFAVAGLSRDTVSTLVLNIVVVVAVTVRLRQIHHGEALVLVKTSLPRMDIP